MPRKGSFLGKRVFLGGLYFRENGARKASGASVLNERELLTMHILKKVTPVCLPGRLTVVYIYRRNESKITIFIMPRKGSFPGKRVFLGASGLYFRENGARKAFGASVLNECELLTMHILKTKSNAGLATW